MSFEEIDTVTIDFKKSLDNLQSKGRGKGTAYCNIVDDVAFNINKNTVLLRIKSESTMENHMETKKLTVNNMFDKEFDSTGLWECAVHLGIDRGNVLLDSMNYSNITHTVGSIRNKKELYSAICDAMGFDEIYELSPTEKEVEDVYNTILDYISEESKLLAQELSFFLALCKVDNDNVSELSKTNPNLPSIYDAIYNVEYNIVNFTFK